MDESDARDTRSNNCSLVVRVVDRADWSDRAVDESDITADCGCYHITGWTVACSCWRPVVLDQLVDRCPVSAICVRQFQQQYLTVKLRSPVEILNTELIEISRLQQV